MKKILSVLLAIAMIASMLPSIAFATGENPVSVTFSFFEGGRSDVTDNKGWIEKIICTPISALGTNAATYTLVKNSVYTSFPTTSEKPGDQWAYIGTSVGNGISRINVKDEAADTVTGGYVELSEYLRIGTKDAGEWTAFRIKVPKTAKYEISNVQAYRYQNATSAMKMYIVPKSSAIEAILEKYDENEVLTSYADNKNNWYGRKTGTVSFGAFGDISANLMGSANLYVAKGEEGCAKVGTAPISGNTAQVLSADEEYYLFLYSEKRGAHTISSLTITEIVEENEDDEPEIPDDITHTYMFGANYMNVPPQASSDKTYYDEFSEINGTVTDRWAIGAAGTSVDCSGTVAQMAKDFIYLYINKSYYGTSATDSKAMQTRPVISLEVKYPGTYDFTVNITGVVDGTEADVYLLSEKELTETYAEYLSDGKITLDLIKRLPIFGRINGVGNMNNIENKLGTATLEKGTYYLLLHCASDNPKTIKKGNSNQYFYLKSIVLSESDGENENVDSAETLTGNVSFAAGADITLNGESYSANLIKSLKLGSEVTVKADNTDGNFAGWVRGKAGSGVYVSSEAEYTFNIMSNTYLTPVWTEKTATDGQTVEFWNENGAYIASASVSEGTATAPSATLTGHVFDNWFISDEKSLALNGGKVDVSDIAEDIIRAVAKYNARESVGENAKENEVYANATTDATGAALSLDRVLVNGVAQTKFFGDKIVCTDNGGVVTHWLRDGKVVSYDSVYTHYIWNGANIYSSYAPIEKKPLVVIEDRAVDGAYMIEYDKGNADEIVEAGILFGSTKGIVIGSTDGAKAASQRKDSHGQFCASPYGNEAYARGYMIYKKGGTTYIIYTDAVAIR